MRGPRPCHASPVSTARASRRRSRAARRSAGRPPLRRADRRRLQHGVRHPRLPRRRPHRPAQSDPARRVHAAGGRAAPLLGARDARMGAVLRRDAERRAPRARGAGGGGPRRRRDHAERRPPAPARGQPPRRRAARRARRRRAACAAGAASRGTSCRRACSTRTPAGWRAPPTSSPTATPTCTPTASPAFAVVGCRLCGGELKPDVVFFGGTVSERTLAAAWELFAEAEALLVVGSSLAVYSGFRFVRRAQEQALPIARRQHRPDARRRHRRREGVARPSARSCRDSPTTLGVRS